MHIKQALEFAVKIKELPNIDVVVLLSNIIKKNKTFLYTHPEYKINKNKLNEFRKFIARRVKAEPVAYIIGHKEFYGLDFLVNKNVLVPRPETEILVEESLKIINKNNIKNILEIGTGSGCVIISIMNRIKNLELRIRAFATDISKKALNVAIKNSEIYNVKNKIKFIKSDLLKNIHNSSFIIHNSILIANLPYLENNLNIKNLKYEPKKALYSGKDGLDLYRKLFLQIKDLKYKPLYILLEFGDKQDDKLKKIIKNILPEYKIKIKKDLAGLNRVLILRS